MLFSVYPSDFLYENYILSGDSKYSSVRLAGAKNILKVLQLFKRKYIYTLKQSVLKELTLNNDILIIIIML